MTARERIKQKMKENDMTADALADAIGVSRSTVFRWLNGKTKTIASDKLVDIAAALHTTWGYLVGDEINTALSDPRESSKEAVVLMEGLSPEKREEGLRYLRYLSKTE